MQDVYDDNEAAPRPDRVKLALPVALLIVMFAFPPEASLNLGSLRFSPYRVLLILMVLPCLFKLLANRFGTILLADGLMLFHVSWAAIALFNYDGMNAIEPAGMYFIECFGSYMLGRRYIRNADDFRALSRFMTFFVLGLLCFTLPESVTGLHVIREFFRAALGGPPLPHIDPRWGLSRAFGSFDHPILYGAFCAAAFSMALFVVGPNYSKVKAKWIPTGVFLACFLSLSAGPWVAVIIQLILAGWNRITSNIPMRWGILFLIFSLSIFGVSLFSNRPPVNVFITYASFSPVSSYNRILIWEYGSAEVARNWWLGIGFAEWTRPSWMSSSMDNFWLLTAVRYGMPALIALVWAITSVCLGAAGQRNRDEGWIACRYAWMITLFGISFAATTVHLWNALFCLFLLFIGSGVFMATPAVETKTLAEQEAEERELAEEEYDYENELGWNDDPRNSHAA